MESLTLRRARYDEIIAQAQDEAPRECCGLFGGINRQALTRYPLRNQAADPTREYFAAPEDLFTAMREMRNRRERLVAIYHSHPLGEARPSATDLAYAFYPEAVYLIIALKPEIEVRAYRLIGGMTHELTVQLID